MQIRRVCALAGAAIVLSAVGAAAESPKDVVATINGEAVTKEALSANLYDWYAPMGAEELVLTKIVAQEAKKAGVVIAPAQIKAKIEEFKKARVPQGQTFAEFMAASGRTPAYAEAMLKMTMQAEAILRKQVKVSDADLATYIKAKHILVRTTPAYRSTNPATPTDPKEMEALDTAGKAKIEEVAKELKNGMSFEDAVAKYSDDPGSKANAGDLGWFTRGQMVPEFEKAAFALKPGQMSEPIKTNYGYHIIKVIQVGSSLTGKEKKELTDEIIQSRLDVRGWIMKLRESAKLGGTLFPKPVVKAAPKQPATKVVPPSEMPPAPPAN